jgi:hypothetical protein
MDSFVKMLQQLLGQDVARRNAALASARLQHGRRQRESVNAFLSQQLDAVDALDGRTAETP